MSICYPCKFFVSVVNITFFFIVRLTAPYKNVTIFLEVFTKEGLCSPPLLVVWVGFASFLDSCIFDAIRFPDVSEICIHWKIPPLCISTYVFAIAHFYGWCIRLALVSFSCSDHLTHPWNEEPSYFLVWCKFSCQCSFCALWTYWINGYVLHDVGCINCLILVYLLLMVILYYCFNDMSTRLNDIFIVLTMFGNVHNISVLFNVWIIHY